MIKKVLDKESKVLESTLVNYHFVLKESDYIQNYKAFKKEFDNLNTLHKEFMKRETFALAQQMLAKPGRTKDQLGLVNDARRPRQSKANKVENVEMF